MYFSLLTLFFTSVFCTLLASDDASELSQYEHLEPVVSAEPQAGPSGTELDTDAGLTLPPSFWSDSDLPDSNAQQYSLEQLEWMEQDYDRIRRHSLDMTCPGEDYQVCTLAAAVSKMIHF